MNGLALVVVVIATALQTCRADVDPLSDALAKQNLFKSKGVDYDKTVDPGYGTIVRAGLSFVCVKLNKRTNKLTTRVYERFSWIDKRSGWKPQEHKGVLQNSLPADSMWKPDIRLFNAFDHTEVRDDANVVILANSTIYWIPPATYTTLCSPSDDKHTYHCRLVLSAWTFDGGSLPLQLWDGGVDTQFYLRECQYAVKHLKAIIIHPKYDCCPQRFDHLVITFDVVDRDHDHDHDDDHDDHDDDHHDDHHDDHVDHHEKKDYSKCRWPHC